MKFEEAAALYKGWAEANGREYVEPTKRASCWNNERKGWELQGVVPLVFVSKLGTFRELAPAPKED